MQISYTKLATYFIPFFLNITKISQFVELTVFNN